MWGERDAEGEKFLNELNELILNYPTGRTRAKVNLSALAVRAVKANIVISR